jgi:cardiolipin synthase
VYEALQSAGLSEDAKTALLACFRHVAWIDENGQDYYDALVAALAGVDVRVMIPRRPDSSMLRLATGSYIKECLQAGIKIYFYEPAMMHSKVVIVDDEFVTTGSTNFDFRSFEHNFEFNALVYSKEFNREMKAIFEQDLTHCTRVSMGKWKQRPLIQKAMESVVRLIAPIL